MQRGMMVIGWLLFYSTVALAVDEPLVQTSGPTKDHDRELRLEYADRALIKYLRDHPNRDLLNSLYYNTRTKNTPEKRLARPLPDEERRKVDWSADEQEDEGEEIEKVEAMRSIFNPAKRLDFYFRHPTKDGRVRRLLIYVHSGIRAHPPGDYPNTIILTDDDFRPLRWRESCATTIRESSFAVTPGGELKLTWSCRQRWHDERQYQITVADDRIDFAEEAEWNELQRRLSIRPESSTAGRGLDLPLVTRSKFLLEGESHRAVIAALDAFLTKGGKEHFRRDDFDGYYWADQVRRMHRDLLGAFFLTAAAAEPHYTERRELQQRLVQAIRRIALPTDKYRPEPGYLKWEVLESRYHEYYYDVNWVALQNVNRDDRLAAARHNEALAGRSVFTILVNLPEGRQATLEYLEKLGRVKRNVDELPQFPAGTRVALVRRMLVVDGDGELRLASEIESEQVRIYDDFAKPEMRERALRREDQFTNFHFGLHEVAGDKTDPFDLGYLDIGLRHVHDPLEGHFRPTNDELSPVVLKNCRVCHAGRGIYGFQSLHADRGERIGLAATTIAEQETAALDKAKKSPAWALFQKLWRKP